MSKMILGIYTFERNPSGTVQRIEPRLAKVSVDTYSSFQIFTFPMVDQYCGTELTYKWNIMSEAQYEALHAIYIADQEVVFQPQNGDTRQFNVEVMDLTPGDAFMLMDGSGAKRLNVQMILKIRSLVVT